MRKFYSFFILAALILPLFLMSAKPSHADSNGPTPVQTKKPKPEPNPKPEPKPGPREGGADD